MKAEHRHELKTNTLADMMGRAVQAVFLTSSCTASGQAPAHVAATYKDGVSTPPS